MKQFFMFARSPSPAMAQLQLVRRHSGMNVPTIVFHVTNCVTLLSQIAIAAFAFAAYKRNHKSGFLFITLASVIFFWNVAFHYLVQFHVVTPEARWSQRDSNIINAIDGAVYIIGSALDVVGIAKLCSRTENTTHDA